MPDLPTFLPLRPTVAALHDLPDRDAERKAAASLVAASRRAQRFAGEDLCDDRGPFPVLFRDAASRVGSSAAIMASVARDMVNPSLGFRRSIPMRRRAEIAALFAAVDRASVAALAYSRAAVAMRPDAHDVAWTDVHLWLPSSTATPIDVVVTRGHAFGMDHVLVVPPAVAALAFDPPPPVAWFVTMESGILILDRLHMRHRKVGVPDPVSAMRAFAAAGIGRVPLELAEVDDPDLDRGLSTRIGRLLETVDA